MVTLSIVVDLGIPRMQYKSLLESTWSISGVLKQLSLVEDLELSQYFSFCAEEHGCGDHEIRHIVYYLGYLNLEIGTKLLDRRWNRFTIQLIFVSHNSEPDRCILHKGRISLKQGQVIPTKCPVQDPNRRIEANKSLYSPYA